jgi:hypothetical protein
MWMHKQSRAPAVLIAKIGNISVISLLFNGLPA